MMYIQKIEKINILIKNTVRALFVRRGSYNIFHWVCYDKIVFYLR